MSRSNPNENSTPNPSTRWFEWQGEHGVVRYYDKERKETVGVGDQFTFILLDQLASVRGWDETGKCGIYSNEVKDSRQETLIVKSYKGGILAEGLYRTIKDRVNNAGADFNANLYIAFKDGDGLKLGSLRLKGAALNAWVEFEKKNKGQLYKQAVVINGSNSGKKGSIVFKTPKFSLKPISPESDEAAKALDIELQEYLRGYFQRTRKDQIDHVRDEDMPSSPPVTSRVDDTFISDDDIPF